MNSNDHVTISRKDYLPSPYLVEEIYLLFKLDPKKTYVTATTKLHINPAYPYTINELILNGQELKLIDLLIDGKSVDKKSFRLEKNGLVLLDPPEEFILQITTEIWPEDNTALSGLYRTSGNYCTQCEAEGFRRITYYLDRPDILARYTTRIEADKEECPVLLSNGNLIERGELDDTHHYAVWHDPYPKPCYLFALVSGDLVSVEDSFVTQSGKDVSLQIFVEHRNRNKCHHAMRSLKKAMTWDEEVYGLEYDLDTYMIVAVDDFNMGAMENKGLNVFNSKYVLASPESATDQDYLGIEGVIAHEYFHNWTGNRVTCRDWFQLSLKEGLTVFRDQEFSADMNSRATQRIDDVRVLRNFQFREDSGPMAHPVRPDSYVEINNFYTVTIYNKGAEVIRMIHHLLGTEDYHKGMNLYFLRFDGQAVTCDDFVQAMEDASGVDLSGFRHWYSQSGTPVLSVKEIWDEATHTYSLKITQHCEPTPGQSIKKAFHIPVELGLLQPQKVLSGRFAGIEKEEIIKIQLQETEHNYNFTEFETKPVLSFLRSFTAPVKVQLSQSREELAFIMAYDTDLFNRWEAANRLSTEIVQDVMELIRAEQKPFVDDLYLEAFQKNLKDESGDKALIAQALTLPSENFLAQQMVVVEPALLHSAMKFVKETIGIKLKEEMMNGYITNVDMAAYQLTPEAMGRRSLKNRCLSYLMAPENMDATSLQICLDQFYQKKNMTDVVAALAALANYPGSEKEEALNSFYKDWKDNTLVLDKWFSLQAASDLDSTLTLVKKLMMHEAFSLRNPNKVRSLIGTFCNLNHVHFHDETGAGYRFLAEQVMKIDEFNSQVAARLVSVFTSYRSYTQKLKVMMQEQLQYISIQKNISADVYEIVKKCLNGGKKH